MTDDGVFVFTCKVFFDMTKTTTSQAFVFHSNSEQKEISECCGEIIDNIFHAPIFILKEKYRKTKSALKNVLRIFEGICNVEFFTKLPHMKFHNI